MYKLLLQMAKDAAAVFVGTIFPEMFQNKNKKL
jgi:hypothetical protein